MRRQTRIFGLFVLGLFLAQPILSGSCTSSLLVSSLTGSSPVVFQLDFPTTIQADQSEGVVFCSVPSDQRNSSRGPDLSFAEYNEEVEENTEQDSSTPANGACSPAPGRDYSFICQRVSLSAPGQLWASAAIQRYILFQNFRL